MLRFRKRILPQFNVGKRSKNEVFKGEGLDQHFTSQAAPCRASFTGAQNQLRDLITVKSTPEHYRPLDSDVKMTLE